MEPILDRRLFSAPARRPRLLYHQLTTVAAVIAFIPFAYGAIHLLSLSEHSIATIKTRAASLPSLIENTAAAASVQLSGLDAWADSVYRWLCPYVGSCVEERIAAPAPTPATRLVAPIPSSVLVAATATTSSVAQAPVAVPQTIVNQPVIERIIVREASAPQENAVSNSAFETRLQQLEQSFNARLAASAASASATFVSTPVFAHSQRIDSLSDVTISNPTITGGSIDSSSISGTITNIIDAALATLDELTATDATFTRATTTNLVAINATSTNFAATSATLTNATTTSLAVTGSATSTFGGGILATRLSATATSTFSGLILDGSGLRLSTLDCSSYGNSGKLTTDSSGNVVCAADQGGSGSTVGGSDTHVQFNNNGAFAGSASFTFSSSTGKLTVTNASTTNITASYASTSNLIASNSFTLGALSGFLKATSGAVSASSVSLTSDITGTLGVSNGGTGWSTIEANTLLTGNGSSALATTTIGSGLSLLSGSLSLNLANANTWTALQTLASASSTRFSVFGTAYFGATATSTFNSDGSLTMVAPITSIATAANTFPYASSTALTVSGVGYFGTASTTALTVSGIQSAVLVAGSSGSVAAASTQTCTNQFFRSLSAAYVATCASVASTDFTDADWGDISLSGGVASLDADTVSDSEIDYATVTLADFTNDADYAKTSAANTWSLTQTFSAAPILTTLSGLLKGNGSSALSAAAAGTDYVAPATTISAGTGLSGGGDLSTSRTLSLNLASANSWTGLQQFANASTTLFSAYGPTYFGATATSSFSAAGALTLASALTVGNGGTGATTLTGLLQGNGTDALTAVTGTAGQFSYYNGTNTLLATSSIYLATSGNVGIGTTTPSAKLDVVGSAKVTGSTGETLTIGGNTNRLFLLPSSGTIDILSNAGTGYRARFHEDQTEFYIANSLRSYLDSDGAFHFRPDGTNDRVSISDTAMQLHYDTIIKGFSGGTSAGPSLENPHITFKQPGSPDVAYGVIGTTYDTQANEFYLDTGQPTTSVAFYTRNASSVGTLRYKLTGGAGTANASYLDTNVSIGTTSASSIASGTALSLSVSGQRVLNDSIGALSFVTNDGSFTGTYSDGVGAEISALSESSVGAAYGLKFTTGTITAANRAERLRISATGNVGIGTTTPWRTLSVTGTVGFDGLTGSTGAGSLCLDSNKQVVYNSGSDACLSSTRATKHDIQNLNLNALTLVESLQPVSFVYNNDASSTVRYGFIAEDTAAVDAHLTTYDAEGAISGIDDRSIISIVVKAIQELGNKIASILDRLSGHDTQIAALEARLAALETSQGAAVSQSQSDGSIAVPDTEAPVITINGNNPATLSVGDTYADLGATVTDNLDLNLGLHVFVGSTPMDQAVLDTSEPNEWHIHYVATDNAGNTATSTRTVIVEAPSIVPADTPVDEPEDEGVEEPEPDEELVAS